MKIFSLMDLNHSFSLLLSLALNLNKPVIIIQNTGGVVDWFVNIPIGFAEHRYLVANDAYDAVRLAFSLIE